MDMQKNRRQRAAITKAAINGGGGLMLAGLVAAVSGCAEHALEPPSDFGATVRHNVAVQVINPEPETLTLAPSPGVRRGIAAGRYQTDTVEAPGEVYTTNE